MLRWTGVASRAAMDAPNAATNEAWAQRRIEKAERERQEKIEKLARMRGDGVK